ncbi:MAG TPA: alpha-amylase family glycosyl hydrolase [Ignavibacteriales bacterium]|nr:alpha-amylase family glycosyl hydrolase [Ignavibacteriales bacterium]HOL81238.1 alpha-amylase family glycosyl hydrolase [Ignavibacteriales bacterium]HOM66385.1 alpha-amylase family glycosyl hydrolase [Ignavibacteriales bacterium]HPD67568.1 alpha-amylase family glycosyl hydrolase [Ignavibacteriales bacterium]HPP33349.1 alpha-amylase family glycosyl hydrolase [Ignavibacteriales bacterium]
MKKILLITIVIITKLIAFEIERVEPSNWWVGFKEKRLQIMLYGKDLENCNVELKNTKARLFKVDKVDNKNYLFLTLDLTQAQPGIFDIVIKDKKDIKTIKYELKLRKYQNVGKITPGDVIYLLMPDRFANGDINNDKVEGYYEQVDLNNVDARQGGDLRGVINNLNYFENLGITALWLTPFQENNQKKYSYHGYAITDFYKVDPRFGSNNDYKELVDKAHKKNIKVIMDMVYNHCGLYHWWMRDLPSYDWVHHPYELGKKLTSLNIFDIVDENNLYKPEFKRTNYNPSTVTDPYASEYDKLRFNKGWFDVAMADLNQNNEFLAQYLIQMTIWWIEQNNLDGLRIDTYPYPEKSFMNRLVTNIYNEYPNFYIVGESWTEDVNKEAFWAQNNINTSFFKTSIKSVISFKFMNAVHDAFRPNGNIYELYKLLSQDFVYYEPEYNMTFLDNHDVQRIYRIYENDKNALKIALTFLLTTRGIPQIYYGTEVLMNKDMSVSHGLGRERFPGGWENDSISIFTHSNLSADVKEVYYFMQNLLKWRKDNKEFFEKAKLIHYIPENQLYIYFRIYKNQTIMVLLNNNDKDLSVNVERLKENIQSYTVGIDVIKGIKYNLSDLKIRGNSSLVLELSK